MQNKQFLSDHSKILPSILYIQKLEPQKIMNKEGIKGLELAVDKITDILLNIDKILQDLKNESQKGKVKLEKIKKLIESERRQKLKQTIEDSDQEVQSKFGSSTKEVKVTQSLFEKFKPLHTPIREATLSQELRKTSAFRQKPRKLGILLGQESNEALTPILDKRSSLLEPIKETHSITVQEFMYDFDLNDQGFNGLNFQQENSQLQKSRVIRNIYTDQLESKYGIILNCTRTRKELRIKRNENSHESAKQNSEELKNQPAQLQTDLNAMPDYKNIELKGLKENASKYGLKPSLTKTDLVRSLQEIWKFQHQGVQMTEFERLMWQQKKEERQNKRKKKKSSSQPAKFREEPEKDYENFLPQNLQWLSQFSQR